MSERPQPLPSTRDRRTAAVAPLPRVGVVLAAGRSERLRSITGGGSKALLRLSGVPLVERAVRALLRAGIERVIVVVGYQAGPVATVVKRIAPGRVRTVLARDWERGNGASLAAAERAVGTGDDLFVVMTADHLFGEGALDPLVRAGVPAVLVDDAPHDDVWAEGTRVRIRRKRAVAFGKEISAPAVDCGVFLLPRRVFDHVRDSTDEDLSLAHAVTLLARTHPLRAVSLPAGAWWQDIDTPSDLRLAKRRLRRALSKRGDGPVSRYLNRPVSTRISTLLAPFGIPPDALSVVSAAVGWLGAWWLAGGAAIAGAIAVHASSVLDGVDGEVARLRLRESPRGALLDGILDRLTDAAIIGAVGFWALGSGASPKFVVVLVVSAVALAVLSMASKDRIEALALLPAPERLLGWLLGGRDGRLLLIAALSAAGRPVFALIAVIVASGATLVLRVLYVLRRAT